MDRAMGADRFAATVHPGGFADHGDCRTTLLIRKYADEQINWVRERSGLPGHLSLSDRFLARAGVTPYEVLEAEDCNVISVAGWQMLISASTLTTGGTISAQFTSSAGRIGVGTANTTGGSVTWQPTVTSADTNLTAGSTTANQYWQLCGAAPTLSTSATPFTVVFTASFASGNANFGWSEFAIDKGTASGTAVSGSIFNHGVTPGTSGTATAWTKVSGQTWNATATLSFGFIAGTPT